MSNSASASSPAVLASHKLGKRYDGGRVGLAPTSLTIADGEHLAIIGPSGCGKTTLLLLLGGLLDPSEGEVREHGELVNRPGWQRAACQRDLGVLFQDLALWPHMSVHAHLDFVLRGNSLLSRQERTQRIQKVLSQASLTALAKESPDALSGGERQRLAWARAVVTEPRLLLLDEPLTSLDPQLRAELLGWTIEYGQAPHRTLVVVTHDEEVARTVGKRMLKLG